MFQGHVCHKALKRRSFGATGLIRAVPPYATSTYVTVAKRWPVRGRRCPRAGAWGLCRNAPSTLAEALPLVEVAQAADQLVEVAGHDGVQLVEVQVDAVVGDAVLREVVGADALTAVARADQGAPLLGPLPVQ